jgi:hypothetical protein
MSSDRNIYLAALVVIAFGIGNSQIRKHMGWVECLSSRANCVLSRVSDRALDGENRLEDFAGRAIGRGESGIGRGESGIGRGQTAVARVQVRLACAQARMAKHQAETIRARCEKTRIVTLDQVQHAVIIERQNAVRDVLNRMKVPDVNLDVVTDDDRI